MRLSITEKGMATIFKIFRQAAGMTVSELEHQVGLDSDYIEMIEMSTKLHTCDAISDLFKYYNIPIVKMLYNDNGPFVILDSEGVGKLLSKLRTAKMEIMTTLSAVTSIDSGTILDIERGVVDNATSLAITLFEVYNIKDVLEWIDGESFKKLEASVEFTELPTPLPPIQGMIGRETETGIIVDKYRDMVKNWSSGDFFVVEDKTGYLRSYQFNELRMVKKNG